MSLLASLGLRGSVADLISWNHFKFIAQVRIGCQETRVRVSDHGSLSRWWEHGGHSYLSAEDR